MSGNMNFAARRFLRAECFFTPQNEFELSAPKSFTAIVPMADKSGAYFQMLYYADLCDVQVLE